jgi:uncharacterized protein YyaL (SSP411 family)
MEYSKEVMMARDWILTSGIQNTGGTEKGGFNAWYDIKDDNYSFVYSEITGYGITTLLYINKFFEGNYLDRAREAAQWLERKALHPCGGVKTRYYLKALKESENYSFESENIYAFDNGMVLYGLINLYKIFRDEKYLELSERIAGFLLRKMKRPDGLFYAVYNARTNQKIDDNWKWSTQSGSYLAKLALGFSDLFEATKAREYKDTVIELGEAAMKFQDPSGRFITSRTDGSTHLHPHMYSGEGLYYAGTRFGRKDFIESAVKAVRWALDNQAVDGGVPKKYVGNKFINYYRSDALAQVIRLGALLRGSGYLAESDMEKLEKAKKCLLSFQLLNDEYQKGGFYYGYTLDGKKTDHINSWCTMFALQALLSLERVGKKTGEENLLEFFI